MWFERYVIIVTSLHRDYLPSSWSMHYPSHIDIGVYLGTIGLFFVFFLLFARYFPVLALNELKTILKSSGESYKNGDAEVHPKPVPMTAEPAAKITEKVAESTKEAAKETKSEFDANSVAELMNL